MMIQATTVSALATAIGIALNNYRRRRQSRRREHVLIQGLHRANITRPVVNRRLVSMRQSEMEGLLERVSTTADILLEALAAEKLAVDRVREGPANDLFLFEEWQACRRADERAHDAYNLATQEYREFVQSLAPPLRAEADRRGYTVMIVHHA
jgi:hypothetical protein